MSFGSFGALVSQWPVTQKRLAVKPNGVEHGNICSMLWGTFDLVVVKVILGSFMIQYTLVSKWPVTQKWLHAIE